MEKGRAARACDESVGKKFQRAVQEELAAWIRAVPETDVLPFLLGARLFGNTATMRYIGPEFLGLPSFRVTLQGERRMVCIPLSSVLTTMADLMSEWPDMETLLDAFSKMRKVDSKLLGAVTVTVGPGTAVYIPAGFIVMEDTVNSSPSCGMRTSLLVPGASRDLKVMVEFLEKTKNPSFGKVASYANFAEKLATSVTPQVLEAADGKGVGAEVIVKAADSKGAGAEAGEPTAAAKVVEPPAAAADSSEAGLKVAAAAAGSKGDPSKAPVAEKKRK
jgi:hypothetical protein